MTERILVVDDDTDFCAELARTLGRRGYEATTSVDPDEALALARDGDFDLVLTDLRIGRKSGIELCRRIASVRPDVPVVVVTGFGSMEAAVETLRAGAFDFMTKPFSPAQLELAVKRALDKRRLEREVKRLRSEVAGARPSSRVVGRSRPILDVLELVARVSSTDATVLVTGESGTGKELVARAIHESSARASGPFVAINCAALPEALLESELFGHTKGAFTDAKTTKRGLFLEAERGTLFLDEIGEMPLTMQAKILRALEDRAVRPVGGSAEIPFDARVVTATNRDLETCVAERTFREDLYYRINVVHIELPPLRSRGDDVLMLATTFLSRFAERHGKKVSSISPAVAERLVSYPWPGNVRELQNAIERAVALARLDELCLDDLPPRIRDHRSTNVLVAADDPSELCTMEEVERRYIARVMEAVGGSKSEAAKVLGLDRSTLYRKLERYRIGSSGA
ncbi:MAG: sigma-54-dependent Fis family transcriptional regulator [Myxococcales bacterium]|nr:sigma-54-dependent Fis family transcriptional regulator [Myxococcales bacterium]